MRDTATVSKTGLLAATVVGAAGAFLLATASATNPPGSPADHFLSYKAKPAKRSEPFAPVANLLLVDRFEGSVRFDAIQARELLVPAEIGGALPTDAVTHLQAYAIKASKVCSDDRRPCAKASECTTGAKCKRPGHVPRLGEVMLDAFGMRSIDVLKPDVLLVPSGKSLTGVPPVPDPATHAVDHFKCYKAKVAKGSSGLAKDTVVTLADQLTDPAKVLGITALTHLCAPASKDGEAVKSVSGHLLCYKAKPAKGEPKHGKRIGVGINNQLGPLRRDIVSESSLCVPAAPGGATPPPATPTPGGATPPLATPTPGVGVCTPGATQSCYGGPAGTQDVGQCQAGIQTCEMGGTFGMCVGQVLPGMEVPGNGVDENCDGMVQPGPELPPDPEAVAPPVDPGVSTTVFAATTFLYTGPDPIQTGVAPGTIDLQRAAVVRGKVLDQTNAPLSGVTISILSHPELGQTLSRADGRFDLAVNGGGFLTVDYRKAGLLPAQRQVKAPWQDYVMAPDVMLKGLDQQMTTVDLTAATPIQVAQSSMMTDTDGSRRATLLFPQGTRAEMVMPDGSTHAMTTLSVRATEYTVGPNGAKAMPGELPPTSGYTYAVELSADEALTAGAKEVRFNQPVPFYVENFVGFPVGSLVPTGFYDRSKGLWIAADNGRVIEVISITGGLADLDLDGNGAIDDATALTALGITDAERQRLASLYPSGQELWRVLIPHFTPWDCNWPYGPPDDATGPGGGDGGGAGPDGPDKPPRNPCKAGGSIIECQTQTLGEVIDLTGTPFRLHYQSDRVPGRQAEANRLEIRLSGATLPASLQRIHLEIRVAGRQFKESFAAAPNLVRTFTWDGKDVYGRTLQGRQRVFVRIGYEYVGQYYATRDSFAASFNRFGVPPLRAARGGGGAVVFSLTDLRKTSPAIILWQDFTAALGGLDIRGQGLGGWTLTAHHAYDLGNTLYLGDGSRRRAEELFSILTTSAGGGTPGFPGDGGPAAAASLNFPQGVTLAPDGSSYIAETNGNRIRRVGPDGMITTVAGNGGFCPFGCFGGDDGLATAAGLNNPRSVALGPDGSLYIADTGHDRIRRVGPDGIITTVAGNGIRSFSGDGGPATAASLNLPQDVALGPDGSLYIADGSNGRVRRVGPDGVITTVAGSGFSGPLGDGGPATAADLDFPASVALGPDGRLYIADPTNHRIRRVGTDGIITTVAGGGPVGAVGDGGPATVAGLSGPQGIALGADGSLYIADTGRNRIRRVGPDGIIATVAGAQTTNFNGDGLPATAAGLSTPAGVAVGPDGSVYVADTFHNRIRRVGSLLPGLSPDDFPIASEDGGEVFVFNSAGRHLRTLDALTGAVLFQFTYDGNDRLTAITDGDGNVTTIERDGGGNPTAIVAPFGRRTTLSLEANGYLASVTNPAGEAFQMIYTTAGLLTQFTDPRSNASQITYDAQNRLLRDTNAAGGFQNLTRSDTDTTYTVSRSTALARTTTYEVEDLATGNERQEVTFPDGTQNRLLSETNGTQTLTLRTGTVRTSEEGPDPRFGMQAPVLTKRTFTTPGGLTRNVTTTRAASVSDPANLLSLTSQTDAVTINGRTSTRVYDAATRTFTLTTPAGRQPTATIDAQGRITQAAVAGLTPVQLSYDGPGRLASLVQGSRSYTYEYDGQGFLSRVTDPLARVLAFTRDVAGRTTTITRPDGEQIHYGYDARGNVVSLTPPGRSAHTFAFTSVDLVERYEPPALGGASTDVQVGYDLDRQVTELVYAGTSVELGYDAAGRLQAITFPQDTQTATYDAAGRLQALTTAGGIGLTYAYDGSLLTDTTWTGSVAGTVHRVFNNDLRLASRTINGAHTQSFVYDADGLLTQAGALTLQRSGENGFITGTTLGTVGDTRGFNGFAEWMSYSATANTAALFSVQYTRDDGGRITGRSETVGGVTTAVTYGYDLVGRLTQVTENGATASYTYDAAGNRLSRTTAGGTVNGVYDAQDRLTQYGTTTYSYTGNGELLSKTAGGQSTTYAYDVLGNLRNVTVPGGSQIEYVIDGRNRRVGKKVDGTKIQGFLYQDRLKPIAELDGNDAVVATFVYGSRRNVPDYMVREGATYRIIADHLGSPRLVVDVATGTIAQRVAYDEFGRVVTDTNPGFQPFGFAGGLYDQATGLVRFGARDYDAQVGRWTSKDAVGLAGGVNLYAYVYDDPVNLIDRTGQAAEALTLLEASAASGAVGSAIGIAGSVIFAIALLESLALENSALESADETGDDEGPNEGGAPDTLPSAPDSPSDGGVCGGDDKPTLPAPRNPDAQTLPAPRNPNAPTLPVPRNPNHPTQPAPRKTDTLRSPQPTGGPKSPNIYDQPIPRPPKNPTF